MSALVQDTEAGWASVVDLGWSAMLEWGRTARRLTMTRHERYGDVARQVIALILSGLAVTGGYLPRPWPLLPRPRSSEGKA